MNKQKILPMAKKFNNYINNNQSALIKGALLYPFILTLHVLGSAELYHLLFSSSSQNYNSIIQNLLTLLASGTFLSIMLIILILFLSLNKNLKTVITLLLIIIPIVLANNTLVDKSIIFIDIIISFNFATSLNKFKSPVSLGKFHISKDWLGFLGTIVAALISAIATILTK